MKFIVFVAQTFHRADAGAVKVWAAVEEPLGNETSATEQQFDSEAIAKLSMYVLPGFRPVSVCWIV
jgi:hypothetical protein